MRVMPETKKPVPIFILLDSGAVIPADSKIIRPDMCTRT